MPANNPARRSSIKIPGPFLIFLSTHEIGHGFTMSKKRKNKNAKTNEIKSWLMNMQATNIPENSSITISELSDFVSLYISIQTQQLKATIKTVARIIHSCKKAML